MRQVLTIEVPIDTAMADERLLPKVVETLNGPGYHDVLFFAVSRAASKAKRRQDHVTISNLTIDWKGER